MGRTQVSDLRIVTTKNFVAALEDGGNLTTRIDTLIRRLAFAMLVLQCVHINVVVWLAC